MAWRPKNWKRPAPMPESWWHNPDVAFEAGADAMLEALKQRAYKTPIAWSDIKLEDRLAVEMLSKGWLVFIPDE